MMPKTSFTQSRQQMVDGQIRPFNVTDTRIVAAFREVPREDFVPEAQMGLAYASDDLPMGKGRFLLDAAIHARLLQETEIAPDHTVLDVGCLTGYSSHILSRLAKSVTAMDDAEWIEQARRHPKPNISFVTSENDAARSNGTFDVIVINGAVQIIPGQVTELVKEGGRIAAFIRNDRGHGYAVLFHKHKNALHQQILFDAFAPLLPGFEKPEAFVF